MTHAPCWRLRSKNIWVNAVPEPTEPAPTDGYYWCAHTMNCLGPDRKVADSASCQPDRECYEAR